MLEKRTINNQGFTLLELAAVVAIMVLVSTIAYANYHDMSKQGDVIGMNERMVNDIRKAQNNSIKRMDHNGQSPVGWGVKIDNTNDKYSVYADFDGDMELSNATKLLIHGTEYSSGSTFTESSNIGRTMTLVNAPTQTTATGRPVGTSGYWSFNGTTQYLTAPDSDDFYFGTGDFTIDFWMYLTAPDKAPYIMGQYEDANNYWYIQVSDSLTNKIIFYSKDGGVEQVNVEMTFDVLSNLDKWIYIAIVRDSKRLRMYKSHQKSGADFDVRIEKNGSIGTTDLANHAGLLTIGAQNSTGYLQGYLDEVRVVKGAAMFKANRFPISTTPYIGGVELVKEESLSENVAIGSVSGDLPAPDPLDLFFSPSNYSTYQDGVISAGNVTITLTNANGVTAKTITINPYGLISSD
ncbi:MAG: LamG-like jellyroll fold domain-containing protein [bacterium]